MDDSKFSPQPFFSRDPIKLIQEDGAARVPIMIGFTKDDGLLPAATFKKHPHLFEYFKYAFKFGDMKIRRIFGSSNFQFVESLFLSNFQFVEFPVGVGSVS